MEKSTNLKSSRLFYYLFQLEKGELDEFARYLAAGAFGKHDAQLDFLMNFQEHVLESEAESVARIDFCRKTGIDPKQIPKKMTDLRKALFEFLALRRAYHCSALLQMLLLRDMQGRDALRYFSGLCKKAIDDLGMTRLDDYSLQVEFEKMRQAQDLQTQPRSKSQSVKPVLDAIDLQFVLNKLKYSCAALNQDRIVGTTHELEMIAPVLGYVQKHWDSLPKLVRAYYYMYCSLDSPENEEPFSDFQDLIFASSGEISLEETKELVQYWANYCARKVNAGQTDYLTMLCAGYEKWLDEGLLLDAAGRISPETFKNIARSMIQNGAIEWAENFTKKYAEKLAEKGKDKALLFNQAMIHYAKGKYLEVVIKINQVLISYEDIFYNLDGRTLLTRAALEMGDWELFERESDAFRKFIDRNKQVPKHRKATLRTVIRLTLKLGKVLHKPPDKVRRELLKLQKEVEGLAMQHNLHWLVARIQKHLDESA